MKLSLIIFSFLIMPGKSQDISVLKIKLDTVTLTCQAIDFMQLNNKELQDKFFIQLNSARHAQYPKNDQETGIGVDITKKMLAQFLKDIDQTALSKNNKFEKEYHFNIAPKGYTDPPNCKDKISIEFYPENCKYRMLIWNTFLAESNWCTEQQVVYSFEIKDGKVKNFNRNEAG